MPQVIQIKRKTTGAGVPATLAPGELAYNTTGHELYVGDGANTVQGLVGAARQLEIHGGSPAQTIAGGAKTIAVANLKITGGNPGEFLSTDGTGNLSYAPAVTASQQLVGSIDAAAGTITWSIASGGGPALPGAAPANAGWYLICNVAGATPPAGAPAATYDKGDWIISNGTAWLHLDYGGIAAVMASDVGVAPAVAGASDVQSALEALAAADANFVVGPATSVVDRIATYSDTTGLLIKDSGTLVADLATKTYVDTENNAQDTLITANADAIAILETNDAAQDAAIALKADITYVDSENDAQDTATAAADDLRVLKAGDTMTGPLVLPVAAPTLPAHAANKKYVDDQIATIPGATPPEVTGPELSGDGSAATPITFEGITAEAVVFGGTGLSTDPLTLLVVDGGVYL